MGRNGIHKLSPESGRGHELIEALYGKSESGKVRAAEELGETGKAARPVCLYLIEAYGFLEKNPVLSETALRSLYKIGIHDQEIFSVLKKLISKGGMHEYGGKFFLTGDFAAKALASFGAKAIPHLLEVRKYSEKSNEDVSNSLLLIADPEAVSLLVQELDNTDENDEVFLRSVISVIRSFPHPEALQPLIKLLKTGVARKVKCEEEIIITLGFIGDDSTVPLLKEYMQPEDIFFEIAAFSLARINTPASVQEVISAFIKTLKTVPNIHDDDLRNVLDYKQAIAARAIKNIGNPYAIRPLSSWLNDKDLFPVVAQGLLSIKTKEARDVVIPYLHKILKDEGENTATKCLLLNSIGNSLDTALVPEVLPYTEDADAAIRKSALKALQDLETKKSQPAEEDKDDRVSGEGDKPLILIIREALLDKSEVTRYNAVEALDKKEPLPEAAVIALLEVSNDPFASELLHEKAREVLKKTDVIPEKVIPELFEDLNSKTNDLEQMACSALANLGVSGLTAMLEARPFLPGHKVYRVNETIKSVKDPEAAPVLIDELKEQPVDSHIFSEIIILLGELRNPIAIPYLKTLLKPDFSVVHSEVITALKKIGSQDSIPVLLELLDNNNLKVFPYVSDALFELGSPEIKRKLIPHLLQMVSEKTDYPDNNNFYDLTDSMEKSAILLGRIKDTVFIPALTPLLSNSDNKIWNAAVHALVDIGTDDAIKLAYEELEKRLNGPEEKINDFHSAIRLLNEIKSPSFISLLEPLMNHPNSYARLYAKVAMKGIGTAEALRLVDDHDGTNLFPKHADFDMYIKHHN